MTSHNINIDNNGSRKEYQMNFIDHTWTKIVQLQKYAAQQQY